MSRFRKISWTQKLTRFFSALLALGTCFLIRDSSPLSADVLTRIPWLLVWFAVYFLYDHLFDAISILYRDELASAEQRNCTEKEVAHAIGRAVATFSYRLANGTIGSSLLEGVDYSGLFKNPEALRRTYAIFINRLKLDYMNQVANAEDAERRAAQSILHFATGGEVKPPLEDWELNLDALPAAG
jgi:hypothetical protein